VPTFIKSLTFDCGDALIVATFWASVLGSNVDEESTSDKAYVDAPGWGGPNMWFNRVPDGTRCQVVTCSRDPICSALLPALAAPGR
jgi:hypothetical protein